jgi:hypothetical protein
MSIAFTKINKFVLNVGSKVFNLATDQLAVALTNTLPVVGTANQLSDLVSVIPGTNLSGTNPFYLTTTSFTQTSGTATLIVGTLTLTATGAVGPFQYAAIYSVTATNHELIGFYDYGSPVTMVAADTFVVTDPSGILTLA